MAFFQTKPNLADGDKAKVELYFSQIAACIGSERMTAPVLTRSELLPTPLNPPSLAEMVKRFGAHLNHDTTAIVIQTKLKAIEKCGSGGG